MSDLIDKAEAKAALQAWLDRHNYPVNPTLFHALDDLPARGVGVKPLVWQPTIDSAGNPHTVTVAFCPVFEKRFYAEGPEDQARIDDKRAARILAALALASITR